RYPGLPSHPTHEVAKRVLKGFGSMISFELRADVASGAAIGAGGQDGGAAPNAAGNDGGATFADRACRTVELIRHATSLGSVESTMERRAAVHGQEHLPPSLLRLSVGIEDVEDLWSDLDSAINAAAN